MKRDKGRFNGKKGILIGVALLAGLMCGVSAPALAKSDQPAYFIANDPVLAHKASKTERQQALERAKIAFEKATVAGGEKAAPYEYYMAAEYLKLAKDEFREGDQIGVIPFAAESRQYSQVVLEKTKGEIQ
jgi:hypothetical protein